MVTLETKVVLNIWMKITEQHIALSYILNVREYNQNLFYNCLLQTFICILWTVYKKHDLYELRERDHVMALHQKCLTSDSLSKKLAPSFNPYLHPLDYYI